MTEKIQPIPHRLKNMAVGGHVAGAEDILDDTLGKNQELVNHDVGISLESLEVDIDNVADDLAATKVILDSKVMEIGDTVYDIKPTLNSAAPVTSDGLYRNVVQADIVIGDPTGDWNPSSAEAAYESVQSEILLLNAELNAAQLEIGAVQTDLVPTSGSANILPSGAIYNYCAVVGDLVGTVD